MAGRSVARLGRPIADMRVRVRAGDGRSAAEGAEGVVEIAGPSVISGYWGEQPRPDAWLDTGDVGYLRDGEVHVSGRAKELLVVNGEQFYPVDIEAAACAIAGVRDSVALLDGDAYHLLVIAEDRDALDLTHVSAEVAARCGLAPESAVLGAYADVERNSSGKPLREATLRRLARAGRVRPRAGDLFEAPA